MSSKPELSDDEYAYIRDRLRGGCICGVSVMPPCLACTAEITDSELSEAREHCREVAEGELLRAVEAEEALSRANW